MSETHATRAFGLCWQNDYDIYHATLSYARDLMASWPNLTTYELGIMVRAELEQWCMAADAADPTRLHGSVLAYMWSDVGDFSQVDPLTVAEDVLYGLGIEAE